MTQKSIGIIGGAGPEAGALLFQQIVKICQSEYACVRDHDFPLIHLLSFPFSEMLSGDISHQEIRDELQAAMDQLQTDWKCIACNTLHCFLPEPVPGLVHLMEETAKHCEGEPLILCSSTSVQHRIHERFFPLRYPTAKSQGELDRLIDKVLAGDTSSERSQELAQIVEQNGGVESRLAVLGCTELSLLHNRHPINTDNWKFIDPSAIAARILCGKVFAGSL